MPRTKDLTGLKFNRLTVLGRSGKAPSSGNAYWDCVCDCGAKTRTMGSMLKNGTIKSCGCYAIEERKNRMIAHGMRYKRIYRTWTNMKSRCYNPKHKSFEGYGGRGIIVCDAWKNDFENFLEWASKSGYNDNLTIERNDVNGNYEPSNCKWLTNKEQQGNRRNTRFVTINGETKTAIEWAKQVGIKRTGFYRRLLKSNDPDYLLANKIR